MYCKLLNYFLNKGSAEMAHWLVLVSALCALGYSLFVAENKQYWRDGFAYVWNASSTRDLQNIYPSSPEYSQCCAVCPSDSIQMWWKEEKNSITAVST